MCEDYTIKTKDYILVNNFIVMLLIERKVK